MKRLVLIAALTVATLVGCNSNKKAMTPNILAAEDHLHVIKLSPSNTMVVIRVVSKGDGPLPDLKSNEDYEVLHVGRTTIEKNTRWKSSQPGIEVYLNVHRTCGLKFAYQDDRGERLFFVRLEVEEAQPDPPQNDPQDD